MSALSNKSIQLGLGLAVAFLIVGSLLLPQFGNTYEYCTGSQPYPKDETGSVLTNGCCAERGSLVACSGCNATTGYATFLSTCQSLVSTQNGTHCYKCDDFGQRTNIRGILLIVLVLGLIALALYFKKG